MIIETADFSLVRRLENGGYAAYRVNDGNFLFVPARDDTDLTLISHAFSRVQPEGPLISESAAGIKASCQPAGSAG